MTPNNEHTREQIDKAIVDTFSHVKWNHETKCHDEDVVYAVIAEWEKLRDYYRFHADFEISVEVVGIYLTMVQHLSGTLRLEGTSEECRDWSEQALLELDDCMNNIIIFNQMRLYPDEYG